MVAVAVVVLVVAVVLKYGSTKKRLVIRTEREVGREPLPVKL